MKIHYAKKDSSQITEMKGLQNEATKRRDEEKEKRKKKKVVGVVKTTPTIPIYVESTVIVNTDQMQQMQHQPMQPIADELPTSNTLFVSNLPQETTKAMLTMLFSQFKGFREVRHSAERYDVAFVEYEMEKQAKDAKESYDGFQIVLNHRMKIEYANK